MPRNDFTPAPPMPSNYSAGFGREAHFHYAIPTGEVPFLRNGEWLLYVRDNTTGDLCEYNFKTDIATAIGKA